MHDDLSNGRTRPYFAALMTFPAACFIATAITDLIYADSANMTWETFSIWLLTIGLIAAAVFVVIGLVQAFVQDRWPSMATRVGYAVVLVLSVINAFVHSRDGYTAVVPEGLLLSLLVVIVLAAIWAINRGILLRRAHPVPFITSRQS